MINLKSLLVCGMIVGVCGLIFFGMPKMHRQKMEVYNNCKKTELFVIGYKGHRNRIYDCTGIGHITKSPDESPDD